MKSERKKKEKRKKKRKKHQTKMIRIRLTKRVLR